MGSIGRASKGALRLSSKTKQLLDVEEQYCAGGLYPLPVFVKSGKGSTLKTVDDKDIIDFLCMFSATNIGQCHPVLLEATRKSAESVTLLNLATKVSEWPMFGKEMCQRFGYDRMVAMVSGTESADSAVKFARKWGIMVKGIDPRKALVLGTSDNYHGTGSGIWPIMNDFGQESEYGIYNENLTNMNRRTGEPLRYCFIEDYEKIFETDHDRIAAVMLECIHGKKRTFEEELGFAIALRKLCKKYNVLFIADEVRMGCGKTGKFLCSDWMGEENKPDIITLGKSITGGAYPASYILGREEIMSLVGGYQSVATYAFTPQAIAATRAFLKIVDDENLLERAAWIGKIWEEMTADWSYEYLDYTTNRGADLCIMLKDVGDPKITGRKLGMVCAEKGVLVYADGNRIRMGVALNITEQELRKGISYLKEALDDLPLYDEIETGPPMKGKTVQI